MKRKIKIFMIVLVIFFSIIIYFNSNTFVKKQEWKFNRGYYIGDYLTDYKNKDIFICFGIVLIIKNPDKTEFGFYSNKKFNL
jgi:hypothetical protein